MNEPHPNTDDQRLDLRSMDVAERKRQELLALFPEVRTEGGKIDFERLKAVLGEMVDAGRERYGMNWPGKADCMRTIQAPSMGTLLPMPDESVDWDSTENVIIQGDNLEVLKLLQKSYLGKVKMIYIDPPYNTGNDFIYPDNFTESLQTYLEFSGQVDGEGRKFGPNVESDGRYHTRWLNMMFPRLYLARQLLTDDGLIFISINDTELDNLLKVAKDIFGEADFVANLIWKSRQIVDSRNQSNASSDHEYILVLQKGSKEARLRGKEIELSKYSNPDNDPRGPWMSNSILGLADAVNRPNLHYTLVDPATGTQYECPPDSGWRYSRETMGQKISEGRIVFPRDPSGRPREKKFLSELKSEVTGLSTVLPESVGYTLNGSREVRDLMGEKAFDFPKPVSLLKFLIRQGTPDKKGIVLDFFAGSGTTGHATMELNREDQGQRRYILVQLPEPTERTDFPDLASLTRERVRRASKAIHDSLYNSLLSGSVDCGFRAYRLSTSNFIPWDGTASNDAAQLAKQLKLGIDHTRGDRTPLDLLFEVLLKSWDEPALSLKVGEETIEGVCVFSIADGAFLICLEEKVTLEFIRALAARKPDRVVMRESAFAGDDQLKTNAVQTFKSQGVTSFKVV